MKNEVESIDIELDNFISHIETIITAIQKEIAQIFFFLSQISGPEFNQLPNPILEDVKKISAGTLSAKGIVVDLHVLIPQFLSDHTDIIEKLRLARHDLRTHLNVIRGYTEFAIEELEEGKSDENIEILTLLVYIISSSNKILSLTDTLNVSRLLGEKLLIEKTSPKNEMNPKTEIQTLPIPTSTPIKNIPSDKISNILNHFHPTSLKSNKNITDTALILIVDDIESNCTLVETWLKRRHYTVYMATSGRRALTILDEHPNIDVILLDIIMPEMDGYEVLKQIKMDSRFTNLIVIMVSAVDELDIMIRCIKEGADDYLIKPFNSFLLELEIKASLEKRYLRNTEKAYVNSLFDELNFAQQIQLSMMPTDIPVSDIFSVYGQMIPAKEIGGDFYDWGMCDGKLCFCIGDVSGKGASAALYMVQMRTILNTLASTFTDITSNLNEFIRQANILQCHNNETSMFVTLFYGILDVDTGQLVYVNAGHNAPFILLPNGSSVALPGYSGLPMGVSEDSIYKTYTTTLEKCSTLILYTDGITEAVDNAGEYFSIAKLEECLRESSCLPPEEIVNKIFETIVAFTENAEVFDDMTLLAVHRK